MKTSFQEQLIGFNSTTRSYASGIAAAKAAEKLFDKLKVEMGARVVINTDGKRFSPVFVMSPSGMNFAREIAARGFQVLG